MRILFTFFVAMLLICATGAYAGVYKYIDADGKIRYTDDLTLVPEEQRAQYDGAEDFIGPQAGDEEPSVEAEPVAGSGEAGTEKDAGADPGDADVKKEQAEYDRLSKVQQELKETYAALEKERKDLDAEKADIKTKKEQDEHNVKAEALNQKVDEYEERVRQFQAEKEQYTSPPDEKPAVEE